MQPIMLLSLLQVVQHHIAVEAAGRALGEDYHVGVGHVVVGDDGARHRLDGLRAGQRRQLVVLAVLVVDERLLELEGLVAHVALEFAERLLQSVDDVDGVVVVLFQVDP